MEHINPTSRRISRRILNFLQGPNWTDRSLCSVLAQLDLEMALSLNFGSNSIYKLLYHIHYYAKVQIDFLETGKLNASDDVAFSAPEIQGGGDWKAFKNLLLNDFEKLASLVANLDEQMWETDFAEKKYGSYFSNIQGMLEHCYYHFGQVVFILTQKIPLKV